MRARFGTVPLPGSGIGTGFPFAQWVPVTKIMGLGRPEAAPDLNLIAARTATHRHRISPRA
jgi:hypothetical protein